MRIINIIDNISKVNFGIWNAAIATASYLNQEHNIESELWFPATNEIPELDENITLVEIENTDITNVDKLIQQRSLSTKNCIIVTHGCWQYATRWGAAFKKLGYHWVYTPHGMLEPWSMQQKKWKKKIYFHLVEKRLSKTADAIRAVGSPEFNNLKSHYSNLTLIPNGIYNLEYTNVKKQDDKTTHFLFMARLHHKKGILPLIKAWAISPLQNNKQYELTIAGPDDGEKELMLSTIERNHITNIKYVGAVYNKQKEALLQQSHFYILPSFSEGFPTSVLEAMQYGLIPIITEGCNFPEVIEQNLAIPITTQEDSITEGLIKASQISPEQFQKLSTENHFFITNNYSLQQIAKQQSQLYKKLLDL